MIPDYVFISLVLGVLLLFFLAIKYFKYLLFYLGVFSGFLISIYGKIFLDDKNYNLGLLKVLFNNVNSFFSNSIIVQFLVENIGYLFLLFIVLLFHRFFYYLLLILLIFFKWSTTGILNWLGNRNKKNIYNVGNNKDEKNNTI